jgi:hypothetical protein
LVPTTEYLIEAGVLSHAKPRLRLCAKIKLKSYMARAFLSAYRITNYFDRIGDCLPQSRFGLCSLLMEETITHHLETPQA